MLFRNKIPHGTFRRSQIAPSAKDIGSTINICSSEIKSLTLLKQGFNFHADQIQLEVQNKIFIQTRDQCYVLKPFLVKKNSSANKRKRYDLMKTLKRDMSQESERPSSATIRNVYQNALKPSSQHAPQNEPKTNIDKTRISPYQSNFKWIKNSTNSLAVSPKPTGEHTGGNPTETVPDGKTTQVDAVNETLPDAQKQKNLYTKSKYSKRRKLRRNSKLPVRNLSLSDMETHERPVLCSETFLGQKELVRKQKKAIRLDEDTET
ncbi:uncharacterized protein LOC113472008 [Diaphorina citri]|uniref:Uncharacterized protein LOC113472008 n=1 Tax=Diaphorina citri TaxID=121845 RepID=A0A3Q0JKI6_DIACI|nr:uncharacterized protein LOC113472008 [Diaphorina citri]